MREMSLHTYGLSKRFEKEMCFNHHSNCISHCDLTENEFPFIILDEGSIVTEVVSYGLPKIFYNNGSDDYSAMIIKKLYEEVKTCADNGVSYNGTPIPKEHLERVRHVVNSCDIDELLKKYEIGSKYGPDNGKGTWSIG